MKNSKNIFLLCAITMLLLSSCGIFNGGSKCDCPKFGENQSAPAEDVPETATASSLD